MIKTINIATDFSKAPAGRYREHGDYTGEVFREDFLLPALLNDANDFVEVVLDGLDGVGASFWDEAFGAMIREEKISSATLQQKLKFVCTDDPTLIPTINSVLQEAEGEVK
jgi:hypothetical protein